MNWQVNVLLNDRFMIHATREERWKGMRWSVCFRRPTNFDGMTLWSGWNLLGRFNTLAKTKLAALKHNQHKPLSWTVVELACGRNKIKMTDEHKKEIVKSIPNNRLWKVIMPRSNRFDVIDYFPTINKAVHFAETVDTMLY